MCVHYTSRKYWRGRILIKKKIGHFSKKMLLFPLLTFQIRHFTSINGTTFFLKQSYALDLELFKHNAKRSAI